MTLDNFVKQQQLIEFSDNGLGIEEKNIDKICTLFRRMHNHVSGTGVGLYIVKKIVENSGGEIEVSSLLETELLLKFTFQKETNNNSIILIVIFYISIILIFMSVDERQEYINEMQIKVNQRLILINELKKKIQQQKEALERSKRILMTKLESAKYQ
jgi:hypothetical protein